MDGLLSWVFLALFSLMLLIAFGLALSQLEDSGVIGLGVVALTACIAAVAIQGMQLRVTLSDMDANAISNPSDSNTDVLAAMNRYVVRSYSVVVRPDMMNTLLTTFPSTSLEVHMKERAFVDCEGSIKMSEVSYLNDVAYLVVSNGATSDGLRADVMAGRVSTIMIAGGLLRIVSVTALDFTNDTAGVASGIATGNDIYVLSARGSAGSVSTDTSCQAIDICMPWSAPGTQNISAVRALSPITDTGVTSLPMQVWGVGGR